ncbi:MAG: PKD domain-containing protein [Saprospirales bacterium]|nr:PKD domain-containing protein [Saprospirales bacterium]
MKTKIFLYLLAFTAFHALGAQTSISGVINSYTAVSAIDYCAARLTVANAGSFLQGQAVLLIQMQGATINENNSSSFGTVTSLGNAGKYERGRIQQISGNDIFLEAELLNTYTISGKVQLVTIPEYTSALVTGALTAQAWSGATGGVLAFDVANTLALNAPIQADAKGFRGGQLALANSNCQWFLDEDNYFYEQSNWRGAKKGEGIAAFIPDKESGRGAQANGGGGGNDHNAGGGGGAQTNIGGQGGLNTPSSSFGCSGDFPGLGGKSLAATDDRIFLGGGGGAGHADDAGTGSSGGQGGGIVLIRAGSIDGQGFAISAKGQDVPQAGGDGAGGGGGGGTVLVDYTTLVSSFDIALHGGKGGNTHNLPDRCYAPGGGGSGGRFMRKGPAVANVLLNGGAAGVNTTASPECNTLNNGATAGNAGQQATFPGVPEGANPIVLPDIDQQPSPILAVCPGQTFSLSVQASGNGLSYQWQVNTGSGFTNLSDNAFYSGAQTPTLTLLDPQASWSGYLYQCVITSACFAPLVSASALLQVETPAVAGFTFSVNGNTVQFQSTSINVDSLSWSFGDGGQSSDPNPQHIYNLEGDYTVTLIAFNACGAFTISQLIQVGSPPEAGFSADFTAGCVPLTVQFEDLSSGSNITSWEWILPGGQPASSNLPNPVVLYENPGFYDVTLIVGSGVGFDTLVMEDFLELIPYPEAFFSYTISGDTAFFDNNSSGVSLSFSWNFGDGSATSNETDPVHVFPGPGVYEVTLTALSTFCAAGTSQLIQVGPNASGEVGRSPILSFFPNPVSEMLTIEMKSGPALDIRFWNAQGIFVHGEQILEGQTQIGLEAWPAGLYWVEWQVEGRSGFHRLLKF